MEVLFFKPTGKVILFQFVYRNILSGG